MPEASAAPVKSLHLAPLLSLASLSLMLGGPAQAANAFSINLNRTFGDAYTGVTATMDFVFGGGSGAYTLDLTIHNTSSPPASTGADGVNASSLTGFAFRTPDELKIKNLLYNQNGTNFYLAKDLSIGNNFFDFCASSDKDSKKTPEPGCGAGSVKDGLTLGVVDTPDNPSATVKFTFNSHVDDLNAVANSFSELFSQPQADVVLAARFQGVNYTRNGQTFSGASGKVTGGGGGNAPNGDPVPGPLPLFGAAAAFGYSRKLRQRLKVSAPSICG